MKREPWVGRIQGGVEHCVHGISYKEICAQCWACRTHAAEHRMRDELPCPWCVIDELKRNRDAARCSATWQPFVDGTSVGCILPQGHSGKHQALAGLTDPHCEHGFYIQDAILYLTYPHEK